MSDNLIPDLGGMPAEVLDAAAKAGYDADFGSIALVPWEKIDERLCETYRASIRAAYPAIARWVAAETLQKAADRIDLRQAELAHLGDISAWEYDTSRDYSEDLAKAWLADEAEAVLDHE